MRSSTEFLSRKIDQLQFALQRPLMHGENQGLELYYSTILRDLTWIEEREDELGEFSSRFLFGCLAVYGQFLFQHLSIDDFDAEIASTYAQVASKLGYLRLDNLLSTGQFAKLRK